MACRLAIAPVSDQCVEFRFIQMLVEFQIGLQDRCAVASADAHHVFDGKKAVIRRAVQFDVEFTQHHVEKIVCAAQRASEVVAHFQHVFANRLFVIQGVETGDGENVRRIEIQYLGYFALRFVAHVAVFLLREVHQRQHSRPLGRIARHDRFDFGGVSLFNQGSFSNVCEDMPAQQLSVDFT